MKILISEPISEPGLKLLQDSEFHVDYQPKTSQEQLLKIIGTYDALVVRSATRVNAQVIAQGKQLKVIGRAGVGVDNVDVGKATEQGIIVVNSPEGNTIAAAEHAFALILALARHIPRASQSLQSGHWEREQFIGVELYGKTLGVIGLGKIGTRVASYGLAFGMEVIGYDPYVALDYAKKLGIPLTTKLEDILQGADIVTLHVPMTRDTKHLLNSQRLAQMKRGARIVNCARGGLIEDAALATAIRSGRIAGAALDVFEVEPPPPDYPLLQLKEVISVPHLGASTVEAQTNVAIDVATQILEILRGGTARSAVNIPSMRPDILAPVKPYLSLAEKLGSLAAQLVDGAVQEVEISYKGEIAEHEVSPLTTALVKGLLEPVLQETVNYVNATLVAKQRKIRITESKSTEQTDFPNLIHVTVRADGQARSVAGAKLGSYGERIVGIDGFKVDAVPTGHLLIVPNLDKPGMIGKIGTFLGSHQVNIASMEVGRESTGGRAVMILNVDDVVPQPLVDQIAKMDGIYGARLVKL